MPFRQLPSTHESCLKALQGASAKWLATTDATQRLITLDQFTRYLDLTAPALGQTGSVYFRFKKETGEAAGALALQTPLTEELDLARGLLRLTISHFIQTLNNAITRGVLPRATRTQFTLAIDSDHVPDLFSDADLLLWAQRIEDGEAARLAGTGATAIAWPSAADVATLRDTFLEQAGPQSEAKDRTDREQGDVEQLAPEVLAAIKDLWDTVEFNLRFEPTNASRRRRARQWGVYYATRPGETPDPTDPPAAEPTSETPPNSPTP
jgi:hypothetical protein